MWVPAYFEGPYGSPAADLLGSRHTLFLLISGGIGITPVQVGGGRGQQVGGGRGWLREPVQSGGGRGWLREPVQVGGAGAG